MRPPTVGTWLVECTVGEFQLAGMRAKLLVYNPRRCPLGKICKRLCVTVETIVLLKCCQVLKFGLNFLEVKI